MPYLLIRNDDEYCKDKNEKYQMCVCIHTHIYISYPIIYILST